MRRTVQELRKHWNALNTHLPTLHVPGSDTAHTWSIVGIRLGYDVPGLRATYSIAPTTHHPRHGVQTPQDILDIALPFTVEENDTLAWRLPHARELYTPLGKITVVGEGGPLHAHTPQFHIHTL